MWAELKGKVSSRLASQQDQMEDTLTDAVFSALRYLPPEVLRAWLQAVLPARFQGAADAADRARFEFWPMLPGGAEPDVVIEVGGLLVVVESKYGSGFGSWGSRHQLHEQWRQALRRAQAERLEGPVVMAVTGDLLEPVDIAVVRSALADDKNLFGWGSPDDAIRWCSWHGIGQGIDDAIPALDRPLRHLAQDLLALLERREVRHMFEGFEVADWWQLNAAAHTARARVYPRVATFAREVLSTGGQKGLVWGGSDSGVVWYESKRLDQTDQWHRDYIQVPFWHRDLGAKKQNYCAMYVLFSLRRPEVSVGWWAQPSRSKQGWVQEASSIVAYLVSVGDEFEVGPGIDWREPFEPVDSQALTAEWIQTGVPKGWWLRVQRTFPVEALKTTDAVTTLLLHFAQSLATDGRAVLKALAADGVLDLAAMPQAPPEAAVEDEDAPAE